MDGKVKKDISLLLFQTLIYSTFYYPSSTDILNFKFYQGRGSEGFGGLWGWGGEVKPLYFAYLLDQLTHFNFFFKGVRYFT